MKRVTPAARDSEPNAAKHSATPVELIPMSDVKMCVKCEVTFGRPQPDCDECKRLNNE